MIGQWSHKILPPSDGVVAIMMSYYTICMMVLCKQVYGAANHKNHSNTTGPLGNDHHWVYTFIILSYASYLLNTRILPYSAGD